MRLASTPVWLGAVLVLAGCADEPVWREAGSTAVEEGEHVQFSFQHDGAVTLAFSVTVNNGPDIDFLVMDEANFQKYTARESYQYSTLCSRSPVNSASGSCILEADRWHLVLDNSDRGDAKPPLDLSDDVARVTYEFEANP